MSDQSELQPLPLSDDDWRRRWLVTGRWYALHRIAEIEWRTAERLGGRGTAICGRKGNWQMPGIFSRMGLKRCPNCCKLLAIPPGDGAPFNELAGWQAGV